VRGAIVRCDLVADLLKVMLCFSVGTTEQPLRPLHERLVLRFQSVEHLPGRLRQAAVCIFDAAQERGIERGALRFTVMDELHALTKHLAFRAVT
jgi:hypothetical protein